MTDRTPPCEAELLPCPFPHEVERGPFIDVDAEDFYVARGCCGDCGATGPWIDLASRDAKAKAAELWNTRSPLSSPEQIIERVARAIREEQVRQSRDNESYLCPAGEAYYEENIGPYGLAKAAIASLFPVVEDEEK